MLLREEVDGTVMLESHCNSRSSLNLPRPVSSVKGTGILLVVEKEPQALSPLEPTNEAAVEVIDVDNGDDNIG